MQINKLEPCEHSVSDMGKIPENQDSVTEKPNNHDYNWDKTTRILGFREDWAVIPYLILFLAGFIVSIIDFEYLRKFVFQTVWVIIGVPTFLFGGAMRYLPRRIWSRLVSEVFGRLHSYRLWKTISRARS